MKATMENYAGRKVIHLVAETPEEQLELNSFEVLTNNGFEVFDRNGVLYTGLNAIRLNGVSISDSSHCSSLCIESVTDSESKQAIYTKSLEIKLKSKKWYQFWRKNEIF